MFADWQSGTGPGHCEIPFTRILGTPVSITSINSVLTLLQSWTCAEWTATVADTGRVEESRAQVRSLGIGARVSIPGWFDYTAVNELLCRTDILVLPSFAEKLPMVILEAFALGIPVISTPVEAISEVIDDGRSGLLVPAGDVSALAHALKRLIEDSDLRRRLGRQPCAFTQSAMTSTSMSAN
jgi:glycosyltransferase involved in cell wall biosynthesis